MVGWWSRGRLMSVNLPVLFFTLRKYSGANNPMHTATVCAQALLVPAPDLQVQWYASSRRNGPVSLSGFSTMSFSLTTMVTVLRLVLIRY